MRTSSIRLRANARVAVLYEDFLEVCDGNMLAAMLLSTLIYWTDVKIAQKDENLWIWKTHEGFQEDLMFDKPGMKPPHRTTISSALELLKKKDFIEWRKNPKMALDRTRQYLVHLTKVQEAIDKLPVLECRKSDKGMSENRLSEGPATEAGSEQHANVEKPTMQSRNSDNALSGNRHSNVEKPTSNTSDYSFSDYSPETTRGTYGANAPTHAPSSPESENQDEPLIPGHDPSAPHLAVNCKSWRLMFGGLDVATCQQYQAAIDDNRERRALENTPYAPDAQDEPYCPDFSASQERTSQADPASIVREVEDTHHDNSDRTGEPVSPGQDHSPVLPGSGVHDASGHTGVRAGDARTTEQGTPAGAGPRGVATEFSTLTVEKPAGASAKVENKRGKSSSQEKTEKKAEPAAPPVCPATDAEWKTTTCLQLFNHWRGKPLLVKYQLQQASQCAKALATNYTREQVEQVRAYMVERDEWWSERPEKVDVCTVSKHMHEKLAEMQRAGRTKKPSASKPVPTREQDPYSIAALLEEQNPGYHARKAEMESLWTN